MRSALVGQSRTAFSTAARSVSGGSPVRMITAASPSWISKTLGAVITLLLTTEALVAKKPEEKKAMMPPPSPEL